MQRLKGLFHGVVRGLDCCADSPRKQANSRGNNCGLSEKMFTEVAVDGAAAQILYAYTGSDQTRRGSSGQRA